jgi:hypothetical protein
VPVLKFTVQKMAREFLRRAFSICAILCRAKPLLADPKCVHCVTAVLNPRVDNSFWTRAASVLSYVVLTGIGGVTTAGSNPR